MITFRDTDEVLQQLATDSRCFTPKLIFSTPLLGPFGRKIHMLLFDSNFRFGPIHQANTLIFIFPTGLNP
jgi:hypothetical protein